ncbi:MAG: MAPEG family protein [Caulobacter sp.]|nr:MAPEG family protein [Vitreoscilla sp.]
MTKTLMIVAELVVINWALIVAASLIKSKAWKPSGLMAAMGNREEAVECSGFPARTERAAKNMLENMVLFSALALVASVGGVADPHVELGARIFFWARLVYIPIYMAGIPVARTAIWAISVIGMGLIFVSIVQAL